MKKVKVIDYNVKEGELVLRDTIYSLLNVYGHSIPKEAKEKLKEAMIIMDDDMNKDRLQGYDIIDTELFERLTFDLETPQD